MQTMTLESPGKLVLSDTPLPAPPESGTALVRVRRVGICGTDLHAYQGRQPFFTYPRILGHELGVEVLAVGPGVTRVRPGDLCAVEPYLHCGACLPCRRGKINCCANLRVLGVHTDGGMREQIVVPAAKLHRSERLTPEQLALVETLAIGCHAVSRASPQPDEYCLIIGAGPIGLATLEFVRQAGARPIILERSPIRQAFCRDALGVADILTPSDQLEAELRDHAGGDLPEVVFDATGSSASMSAAFGLVAPGGRLIFVGLTVDEIKFRHPTFHKVEGTLLCSRNSLPGDFIRIIDLIERGVLDTRPWISSRPYLAELPGMFPALTRVETGVIKAVVRLDE
jgi:2-desacetyl-2-hydroxyethyl bacteriochlorophyllide A dehydrogenase